ncbi:hypothetical protein C7408_1458 [Paraburkholderia caballeronis]|nr:hypothetical protein C7408_1458 [Paraburkholderia caballeronis]TDV06719.1 hypothetical protein C7406_1438 [Paraburkholderia caballeronis]TDV16142.1 hypothetical protein C7404_1448 [Paraburkholderia caballeronis]
MKTQTQTRKRGPLAIIAALFRKLFKKKKQESSIYPLR